eukprot:15447948-Alexandrium_andersonii.AAC.1
MASIAFPSTWRQRWQMLHFRQGCRRSFNTLGLVATRFDERRAIGESDLTGQFGPCFLAPQDAR